MEHPPPDPFTPELAMPYLSLSSDEAFTHHQERFAAVIDALPLGDQLGNTDTVDMLTWEYTWSPISPAGVPQILLMASFGSHSSSAVVPACELAAWARGHIFGTPTAVVERPGDFTLDTLDADGQLSRHRLVGAFRRGVDFGLLLVLQKIGDPMPGRPSRDGSFFLLERTVLRTHWDPSPADRDKFFSLLPCEIADINSMTYRRMTVDEVVDAVNNLPPFHLQR